MIRSSYYEQENSPIPMHSNRVSIITVSLAFVLVYKNNQSALFTGTGMMREIEMRKERKEYETKKKNCSAQKSCVNS